MQLNDQDDIKALRTRLQDSLAKVAMDLHLRIAVGACRFEGDGAGLTFKLEVERDDALPKFERELRERFDIHADANLLAGLNGFHCEQLFKSGAESYRIVGLKGRVKSKPLVARQAGNGRLYRFKVADVAKAFGLCERNQ
jgi:hypothetical protein